MSVKKQVRWVVGLPSLLHWWEADRLMLLSRHTNREYVRYRLPPVKVVRMRPLVIEKFMLDCPNPLDTLVLVDVDHSHPTYVVNSLAEPDEFGVHTSLTFKREPKMPVASAMNYPKGFQEGEVAEHVAEIRLGEIIECDRGGHAAIAVQRRVFSAILDLGYSLQEMYMYKGQRDCDQWFAKLCHEAGFKHYVNTAIVSPHYSDAPTEIGLVEWDTYMKGSGRKGLVIDAE